MQILKRIVNDNNSSLFYGQFHLTEAVLLAFHIAVLFIVVFCPHHCIYVIIGYRYGYA